MSKSIATMKKMTMKEIKSVLMGKRISYNSTWYGSNWLTIGHIENDNTSVRVFQTKGKGWGIFIPKEAIPALVESGQYQTRNEIEQCTIVDTWKLN